MMSFSSSSTRICFNSLCNDALERPRKGWRRRTGEFADLCDRCASTYEEGKFCETFHMNASGWRCCESCGQQIHCGCIVSFHTFVLLDAGGIECMTCARKSFILTPNPAWPPPSLFLPALPDRIKDLSAKNWDPIAESGPVPWRQAPSLFSSSSARSGLQPRMPFEVDLPNGIDRLITTKCLSAPSLEKKKLEDSSGRSMNGSLKFRASEIFANGKEGNGGEQDNPVVNDLQKASFSANEVSMSHIGMAVSSALPNEANDHIKAFGSHVPRPMSSQLLGKQFSGHNGADTSGESQLRNGKPRGDGQLRNQLLPRYRPRITEQELQQISGNSSSVITPLFEKMLSASDAGRIGRLVLPKKCAEAYFPSISQPEGSPLKVQDSKGNEWIFQFRFWPNNNSRMYVLEGVTPCIQSMQLQAGDIVTFSRIEPEGKLVMGFRKASTPPPSDKGTESVNATSRVSTKEDVSAKKTKPGEVLSTPHHLKGNSLSPCNLPIDQANPADQASPRLKDNKSGCVATEVLGAKSSIRSRRKNSTLASKVKRLKIEDEHVMELKLTWEQAQGLLRPPPNYVPGVVVIEGVEFEEYEDAPIIGRPTIFAANCVGEKIQWAQCEDCFKLRKVPFDALLPSRWTCSENSWDPERSFCSVAQELTAELEYLLPASKPAASKKRDPDSVEDLEGLDALANLAIQEEGGSPQESSQTPTTKHPRHRPGCSCVICIQPPSGKGPKHKQTCTCTICLMVKRRFQTLMLRREKKQSEKEAEIFPQQKFQQHPNFSENVPEEIIRSFTNVENRSLDRKMMNGEDFSNDDVSRITSSVSPFKGQIDLNSQPERDDELSPRPDSDVVKRIMENAFERDLRLHFCNRSRERNNSEGDQTRFGGLGLEG